MTSGCVAFADRLRAAGHLVHTPDLYEGRTFTDLADGVGHARKIGFDTVIERGRLAAGALPADLVYVGFSLGALPAQSLAQNRPGARGAVLLHACIPPAEFGSAWPSGLPLQIHTMTDDAEGDVDVAKDVARAVDSAELFLYPGDAHLFTDNSLPAYDAAATALVYQRVLALLATLDAHP